MDYEFVVAMLVEALQTAAIAAYPVHARCRVGGQLDPFAVRGVELRVYYHARKLRQDGFAVP